MTSNPPRMVAYAPPLQGGCSIKSFISLSVVSVLLYDSLVVVALHTDCIGLQVSGRNFHRSLEGKIPQHFQYQEGDGVVQVGTVQ